MSNSTLQIPTNGSMAKGAMRLVASYDNAIAAHASADWTQEHTP